MACTRSMQSVLWNDVSVFIYAKILEANRNMPTMAKLNCPDWLLSSSNCRDVPAWRNFGTAVYNEDQLG